MPHVVDRLGHSPLKIQCMNFRTGREINFGRAEQEKGKPEHRTPGTGTSKCPVVPLAQVRTVTAGDCCRNSCCGSGSYCHRDRIKVIESKFLLRRRPVCCRRPKTYISFCAAPL